MRSKALILILMLSLIPALAVATQKTSECWPDDLSSLEISLQILEGDVGRMEAELLNVERVYAAKLKEYAVKDLDQLKRIRTSDPEFAKAINSLNEAVGAFQLEAADSAQREKVEMSFSVVASFIVKYSERGGLNSRVVIAQLQALEQIRNEWSKGLKVREQLVIRYMKALNHLKELHLQCGVRSA